MSVSTYPGAACHLAYSTRVLEDHCKRPIGYAGGSGKVIDVELLQGETS